MTINDNISLFNGRQVEIYSEEVGITHPDKAYKIMLNHEEAEEAEESGKGIAHKFKNFLQDKNVGQVQALIFGAWEYSYDSFPDELIPLMIENVEKLKNLKAIFMGEMTYEECEISWIQGPDYSGLLNAFKNIELFRVRGNFSLGVVNHDHLKSLIFETGGLPSEIINNLTKSNFPTLEHLELWLGDENYGFDGNLDTLKPLFDKAFTQLNYLGMRNSEITDDIAEYIANHKILDQISVLDLSMGTLSDKGGKALLASPKIKSLKKLDLHHHYLSDIIMKQFGDLGIEVDLSAQEAPDSDGDRYVAVSE